MPNMSRTLEHRPPAGLADALFPSTRQRVLACLFGRPGRSFYATELVRLTGGGSGAVQRELARLAHSGLATVRRIGNQKHYQANPESPIFSELRGIVEKTLGLAEPLRQALARKEFRQRAQEGRAFTKRALSQPKIWLMGEKNDLEPWPRSLASAG